MPLDFPSNPSVNDTYSNSGRTWKWNGSGWELTANALISSALIQDDAVTYAKIQNVSATDKLLGRSSAGAGDIEEITCTAAGRALLDDADAAAQRTTLGLGTLATQSGTFSGTSSGTNTGDQTITLTGDVTGSGTGSFATAIAAGVIVNADVNASAAIAGTKVAPDFGSQNVVTTGTATAASLNPTGSSVPTNGVYLPAANSVAISTNGTERLFIASDGKVGLGTSSPGTLLDIASSAASTAFSIRNSSNASELQQNGSDFYISNYTASGPIIIRTGSGTERARIDGSGNVMMGSTTPLTPNARLSVITNADFGAGLAIGSTASAVNWARLDFKNTNAASPAILYQDQAGLFAIRTDGAYPITFNTNGANERMRITAGGSVLCDSTTLIGGDTAPLQADGKTRTALALKGGSNGFFAAFYNTSSTLIGSITGAGGATTFYNTSSDYRLKENVVPLTEAISRVNQLQVHRFNFISHPDQTVDGFIAHEVQEVVPECVTGTKDQVDETGKPVHQGIDQSKLVPLLTAALQEAIGEIASLKDRVAALEAA